MRKISLIIPTFNEAHNIEGVIDSASWVDEIIVVDSFSEDETANLAKAKGAKVLERKYTGPSDQKNWVIPQAAHEWVLILDADERVTPELKKEIQAWLKADKIPFDAFWINRQNYFMGQKVKYSGWQGDAVVRFFKRDVCRYDNKQVHEEIQTSGIKLSRLKEKMDHYTYKDLSHFLDKMRRYAKWSAEDHFEKTPKVRWGHLIGKPFFRMIKHFFLQKGFLDGKVGFIISIIMAWGVFLRYVYIRERQKS